MKETSHGSSEQTKMWQKGGDSTNNLSHTEGKSMHELLMESYNKQHERSGVAYEPPAMDDEAISESNEDSSLVTSEDPAISIMQSDGGDDSLTLKVRVKRTDSKKTSSRIRNSMKKSMEPVVPANMKQSQIGKSQENSHATKSHSNSYSNVTGVLDQES